MKKRKLIIGFIIFLSLFISAASIINLALKENIFLSPCYANSLIAYYPLDSDTNDYNPIGFTPLGSCSVWNPGTAYGGTSGGGLTPAGKKSGAYKFDGVDDYIKVADSSNLDFVNKFTISG